MTEPRSAPPPESAEGAFRYVHTANFPEILEGLSASLVVSTYQAGKLIVVRASGGRLSTLLRHFERPMGLAVDGRRLAIGTKNQIWLFRDAPDVAPLLDPPGTHDACYLPRASHVTGDIRGHEVAWSGEELWAVNTRFSCLCTLHPDYSFVPRWRPSFISALAAEDRCHLNGLAMAAGRPCLATALGETDTPAGWRPGKAAGGCLIDVAGGEPILRGLSMPHSPRVVDGRAWLLESGRGWLAVADLAAGRVDPVAELPGFTRGLAFAGRYAFVGLSKVRESATFGGLPIAGRPGGLKCGVWVVDLTIGAAVAFLEFQAGVEEIFDVQVLPGVRFPAVVGLQKGTIDDAFVVPRAGEAP